MQQHLTVEQRKLALGLRARGLSLREIGPQVAPASLPPGWPLTPVGWREGKGQGIPVASAEVTSTRTQDPAYRPTRSRIAP